MALTLANGSHDANTVNEGRDTSTSKDKHDADVVNNQTGAGSVNVAVEINRRLAELTEKKRRGRLKTVVVEAGSTKMGDLDWEPVEREFFCSG